MADAVKRLFPERADRRRAPPTTPRSSSTTSASRGPFTPEDLERIEADDEGRSSPKKTHVYERIEVVSREEARGAVSHRDGRGRSRSSACEDIPGGRGRSPSTATATSSTCAGDRTCRAPGQVGAFKLHRGLGRRTGGATSRNEMLQRIYGTAFGTRRRSSKKHLERIEEARSAATTAAIGPGARAVHAHASRGARLARSTCRRAWCSTTGSSTSCASSALREARLRRRSWVRSCSASSSSRRPDTTTLRRGQHVQAQGAATRARNVGQADELPRRHCLIFNTERKRSYRELPLRIAEFSRLHRNERSGTTQRA